MFKAFSTRLRICQQNDKKREREMSERRERGVFLCFCGVVFFGSTSKDSEGSEKWVSGVEWMTERTAWAEVKPSPLLKASGPYTRSIVSYNL